VKSHITYRQILIDFNTTFFVVVSVDSSRISTVTSHKSCDWGEIIPRLRRLKESMDSSGNIALLWYLSSGQMSGFWGAAIMFGGANVATVVDWGEAIPGLLPLQ
jgi:hypothetical protein